MLHLGLFTPRRVFDISLHLKTCASLLMAGLLFLVSPVAAQARRPFPPLFNTALQRPVTTTPSDSTCGSPQRNAYCLSSTNGTLTEAGGCIQGYCLEACPGRTAFPVGIQLLIATSPGYGDCIRSDTVNTRPGSSSGVFATVITTSQVKPYNCFLEPTSFPRLDVNGVSSFTITAWFWLDTTDLGTLIEKIANDGRTLFSLQVGVVGFRLSYGFQSLPLFASADVIIPHQEWTHVTVQVHDTSVSFYVNGGGPNLSPDATVTLISAIPDTDGTYRIGLAKDGSIPFLGKIQDIYLYQLAISNREVQAFYSAQLPPVRIQSECRCQGTYPRVKPGQTHYCIKNGDRDDTSDFAIRISRDGHPLEYINDGDSNSMWISKFQRKVEIDVDLGDQFQVFYVVIQFYSPQPKAVTILRQREDGEDFQPWQYYADDCTRFGLENNGAFTSPDSVNCLQFGTNGAAIPYSLGNITFSLLASGPVARPGSGDFYNTMVLHDFVRAKRVKVIMEDHFYVTNIRHEYYAVFEYIVTGWCDCNGHASACDTTQLPYTCNCSESSHTEGIRCNQCKPLFNDKPYRKGDNLNAYPCLECQCYGHADSCRYDASVDPFPDQHDKGSGGVCVDCQHFTTGRFCDICMTEYFRPNGVSLYDADVCQACECDIAGVMDEQRDCEKLGGKCECKTNVEGRRCDRCKLGFFNLNANNPDGCQPCFCDQLGVKNGDSTCNQTTGQCNCKANVRGLRCEECDFGYFGLAESNVDGCTPCNCNPIGSTTTYCDPSSGQCQCQAKVQGIKCDDCKDNFFNFTAGCVSCNCDALGTEPETVCDKTSGQCMCKRNVEGIHCDSCKDGAYNYGISEALGCDNCLCQLGGTVNGTGSCSETTGDCFCKENVQGRACSECAPNTWGLNASDPLGCQSCGCDPTGTSLDFQSVCDQNTGQCSCLSNRQGPKCDACANGFYINPSGGCLSCDCHTKGTLKGTFCDTVTGQCECKSTDFGVTGRRCDECLPTFYKFDARLGYCKPCNCLEAGSMNDTCHAVTGRCECKELVEGVQCNTCKTGSSQLDASNPSGCSAVPFQQPPPDITNITSTTITLTWNQPDHPNGVISAYKIYRNDTQIYEALSQEMMFVDSSLNPYTFYSYTIEAVNAHGSTTSTPVIFQTLAGRPSNDMELTVEDIRARSAFCSWTSPSYMNGPLLHYVIMSYVEKGNKSAEEWLGLGNSIMLTALTPYTDYTMTISACTVGGCVESKGVQFITQSAPPEDQEPPVIVALDSTALLVTWKPPLSPNGIITFYELWFRGPRNADGIYMPPASRIFHPSGRYDPLGPPAGNPLGAPATSYRIKGLKAFTTYEFQVLSENDAGKAASIWAAGRTQEAMPNSVKPPSIQGISTTQLEISWSTPSPEEAQGTILVYRLYQNIKTDLSADPHAPRFTWKKIFESAGSTFRNTISGLTPYTDYSFLLETCNSKGCVNSTANTGRTLIAAPEGVQKPQVDGFNSTVMEIKWDEPLFPNGPPPKYTVQKTNIALSYPASVVRGTRFTGGGYYAFHPSVIPQNVAFTGIRFKFRLERGTGILLFSASSTQEEFIAVQFVNGRPRFLFDTQGTCSSTAAIDFDSYTNWTTLVNSGFHTITATRLKNKGFITVDDYFEGCKFIAFVTTTNDEGLVYNDRKWHSFEARRVGIYGKVTVDEVWSGQSYIRDSSCQDTGIIGPTTAVYVGGFPSDFVLRRTDRTRKVETSFLQGCIEKVEILHQLYPEEVWKTLDWTQGVTNDLAFLNWQGCPINLEPAFHFMGKGFLILANCNEKTCNVRGSNIVISFRMRTALHTGFLFLMHGGTGIYMYSVLTNGVLRFVISDNNVRTAVTYDDPSVNFCDGKWRKITFEKIGQQASVSVKGLRTYSLGDPNIAMNIVLTSDIFLGGLKPGSSGEKFMKDNGLLIPDEGFGGCIANLVINDKSYEKDVTVVGVANTNMDGCPPYHEPEETCQAGLITQLYQGMDRVAYETGLLPYTDYIYRVIASNEKGNGSSSWAYGRTREGAPSGVQGPSNLRAINGDTIEVIWDEPDLTYGLLTKYVVVAYENDTADPTFEEMDVNDVRVTGVNMTGVTPNTAYLVKVKACTSGGCTESEDGMDVLTPIEAPGEVPAPTAEKGATYLHVKWSPPAKPNGPITGYFLYKNRLEVYKGGETSFNVTDLQVYTAYTFYIAACTSSGCTDGPSVALSTDQLPPTSVIQPTVVVMGTSKMMVSWEKPDQLNGVLKSYFIMASTIELQLGDVVYNSSVLFPSYVIEDLHAGTTYYITLGACTEGGCTLGPAASATTQESAPGGVKAPVVTSPSPSQLEVKWDPPTRPNGEIISYDLFQNGISVYKGLNVAFSINSLQPYSLHIFSVSVCTVEGCARSEEVEVRTMQAPPVGNVILEATVADDRTVNVSWSLPDKPNGNMTFQVFFSGLFYLNIDAWNYTTVEERRKLLVERAPYTVYQVGPLVPFSTYTIQINSTNQAGYILSNVVTLNMPPGSPDGMAPPTIVSDGPRAVKVSWRSVGRVNAEEVPAYRVQFQETTENSIIQDVFGPTVTLLYTKENLEPYTEYRFRITASNSYGSAISPWVSMVTKQDKPASMNMPLIAGITARYVDITWSIPLAPNGIISHFNIFENDNLKEQVVGNLTSNRIDGLLPFSEYYFNVEACTVGGCTKSLPSSTIKTLEDIPEQLAEPQLTAMSPTSVQIKWTAPAEPHGVITNYILQRQNDPDGNVTTLATQSHDANMIYLDESNELSPFTSYKYRVNVQNGAGIAEGSWAQITTGASRPAGVRPPTIISMSPTLVTVRWEMPVQVNGQLEEFILQFPDPQIIIRNVSQFETTVSELIPYTQYSVTLTACTAGGCTESAATSFTTDSSLPSGQAPPSPVAISQSIISISWQPPVYPSGPNLKYELSRMKVRQPLDDTVTDIGEWSSLYIGAATFYEDRALPMFTTFVYRITSFNDIGQIISNNSVEATTWGGLPRLPPIVFAEALDHQSIEVNWTLPSSVQLQGEVQNLSLETIGGQKNATNFPAISAHKFVVSSLQPNTLYQVKLIATIFGGAKISNEPFSVRTEDGAPEGLDTPVLTVISTSSLRVSWAAPSKPNGVITNYKIIFDRTVIDTGFSIPGSRVISDLEPFTIYEIQMEACTVFACVRSNSAFGSTAEASPLGLEAPTVTIQNSTQAKVFWEPPAKANGVILRYDLWRRTKQNCNDLPKATHSPEIEKCTYVECGILENLCGTTCYSGPKVCCDGVIHDARTDFACCGKDYIFQTSPNMICCDGQFFTPATNHECCGNRYLEVLPGQVCCPDKTEDRVSISEGDSCCGSVPYLSNGVQMCCKDVLMNSFERQCCGGEVTSDTTVCCGNSQNGLIYLPRSGYRCCGQSYVEEAKTLCCVSDTGHAKAHFYNSESEKDVSAHSCCGMNVISSGLSCCNFVGYDSRTQVCSDKSSHMETGCGIGNVCSISLASSALCDRCDFDTSRNTCSFAPGYTSETSSETSNGGENGTVCTLGEERIFSGLDLAFEDNELAPFSKYEYYVVAVNSAGIVTSDATSVRTLEAVPEGVHPPNTKVAPGELFAIYVSWTSPKESNGDTTGYSLKRDGIEIYTGMKQTFTDDFNILPYKSYSYTITACNIAGCTQSIPTVVATAQAVPEEILPPLVKAISPTEIKFTIQPPGKPNGVILVYSIILLQLKQVYNSSVPEEFIIDGLSPYTHYTLEMLVCTVVGCAMSSQVNVTTKESPPEGLIAPRVIVVSSTRIELYWRQPDAANGKLNEFTVLQTSPVPVTEVYVGFETYLRLAELVPVQSYTYQLKVSNGAGTVLSQPVEIVMPLSTPLNVPPPRKVTVLSSTSMKVEWNTVIVNEGEIDQYRILLNTGKETEVQRGVGLVNKVTISDLVPFTEYEVRLQACLRNVLNGCGTSSDIIVTTEEALPLGLDAPELFAVSFDTIMVEWMPPENPYGVITRYRVYQRNLGSTTEILINQVLGNVHQFIHSGQDLKPFTEYEYKVVAQNSKGETDSEWTTIRTKEAIPEGLLDPVIDSTSSYGIIVSWVPPQKPNGIIVHYKIFHQKETTNSQSEEEFLSVGGNFTSASISGLDAFSTYLISLEVTNSAGQLRSGYITASTKEGFPAGLPDFQVEKITSGTSVILTWNKPARSNGVITMYKLYEADDSTAVYIGLHREFEYRRLSPFTIYSMTLEACTSAGCTMGKAQSFTTAEVAPSSQPSPTLGTANSTHVTLHWTPPINSNGLILSYEVLRRVNLLRMKRSVSILSEAGFFVGTSDDKDDNSELLPDKSLNVLSEKCNSGFFDGSCSFDLGEFDLRNDIDIYEFSMTKQYYKSLHRARRQVPDYEVVYKTTDTDKDLYTYTDSSLRPHTQYQYSIRTTNAQGQTDSPWQTVTTEQAPPEGIQSLTLSHIPDDIHSIKLEWSPPQQLNGILQSYQIQRNDSIPNSFPADTVREFIDTQLSAFTMYSYTLTACTGGGCTTSEPVMIRTTEASPLQVRAPLLQPSSPNSIQATWFPPEITNGQITLYKLKVDGEFVYSGLQKTFTITGLVPYSKHQISLTACTNGGCTESREITGRPLDAPPTDMPAPLLRVLGSTSVEVNWSPPNNPNGVISSYDVRRHGRLVYTSSIIASGILPLTYTDYSLEPGERYTYTVMARNRKGSVESGPSSATTYSASPTGLAAPTLTAISSTAIKAEWSAPARPNGLIRNYTLYLGSEIVYTGPETQLIYTIPSLNYYSEYQVRVKACTDRGCVMSAITMERTLEAPPQDQPDPSLLTLADETGSHAGVRVSWEAPEKMNGILLLYELHRREVITTTAGTNFVDSLLIYNGTSTILIDRDPNLKPFSDYQYMVMAFNKAGQATSTWTSIRTKQGRPQEVAPPSLLNVTSTTIIVKLEPPGIPNGRIQVYKVLVNETILSSSPSLKQTVGSSAPLLPFTTYALKTQACTAVACGESSEVIATTDSDKPHGLDAIQIKETTNETISLEWRTPLSPNGIISLYKVYQRQACPHTTQPLEKLCIVGDVSMMYSGMGKSWTSDGFSPYTAYEFQVQAYNDKGGVDLPTWVRAETKESNPLYIQFPNLLNNGSMSVVSWKESFKLNGRLREYLVLANGTVVYKGFDTKHGVQRKTDNQIIVFIIQLITDTGQAETPAIIFDPTAINNIGTTTILPTNIPAASKSSEVYEEAWFIAVMCVAALVLIFILIGVCLCKGSPKAPYIRERMPLPRPDQPKPMRNLYVIDAGDGSVLDANIIQRERFGNGDNMFQGPGYGLVNPAFTHDGHLSQASSSKFSRSYTQHEIDDTMRDWDKLFDSGLFDDLDDDEDDESSLSLSQQTYSYTKEQTVFTDTHL